MSYLIYDTETTGLPCKGGYDAPNHPDNPCLCELGAALFNRQGVLQSEFSHYITPYYPEEKMNPHAAAAHGLTHEKLLAEGIPLINALQSFDTLAAEATVFIAHNQVYDWLILRKAYLDLGISYDHLEDHRRMCTKELGTMVCKLTDSRGRLKWPKLEELHFHLFNETFDGAHGATADLHATARCFFRMLELGYTPE